MTDLEEKLKITQKSRSRIIVTDGVNHGESKDYRWESELRNGTEKFSVSNQDKEYHFKNIGHFQSKEKDVYAWKVNKASVN